MRVSFLRRRNHQKPDSQPAPLPDGDPNIIPAYKPIVIDFSLRNRLYFDLIECDLRQGKWKEAIAGLKQGGSNLRNFYSREDFSTFYEKCIKIAMENTDQALLDGLLALVDEKFPLSGSADDEQDHYAILGLKPEDFESLNDKEASELVSNAGKRVQKVLPNGGYRGDEGGLETPSQGQPGAPGSKKSGAEAGK